VAVVVAVSQAAEAEAFQEAVAAGCREAAGCQEAVCPEDREDHQEAVQDRGRGQDRDRDQDRGRDQDREDHQEAGLEAVCSQTDSFDHQLLPFRGHIPRTLGTAARLVPQPKVTQAQCP
jgi:hypothetical protein